MQREMINIIRTSIKISTRMRSNMIKMNINLEIMKTQEIIEIQADSKITKIDLETMITITKIEREILDSSTLDRITILYIIGEMIFKMIEAIRDIRTILKSMKIDNRLMSLKDTVPRDLISIPVNKASILF